MGKKGKSYINALMSASAMMMLGGGYDSYYDFTESNIDYTPCKYKGMSNKELNVKKNNKRRKNERNKSKFS